MVLLLGKKKPTPSLFGRRVVAIRESLGLNQLQLAERAGISPSVLSRLETKEKIDPKLSTIQRIAESLGVSPAELVAEE